VPPFEEVEPQLAQQLEQEKETEAIERLLKDLRAEADIVVNL
jgi:competence CoiA-like predicted nuclease